jgi:hypothetical protein
MCLSRSRWDASLRAAGQTTMAELMVEGGTDFWRAN